jgi:hypothetical protein
MTISQLPPDLLKRLTYSKYMLGRGYDLWHRRADLEIALAISLAHDSAEMLMRAIADHEHVRLGDGFLTFWDAMNQKTGKEPPHKGQMDRLNTARGGFKHKGILPSAGVADDLLPITKSFCEEATEMFLAIKYDEVSLADLIAHPEARNYLKEAEAAMAVKNTAEALTALGNAFDMLIRDAIKKNEIGLLAEDVRLPSFVRDQLGSRLDKIVDQLTDLYDTVNMQILGIDPIRERKFAAITPLRQRWVSGKVTVIWRRSPETIDPSACDFGYRFVLESGLRLQSL